MLKLKRLRVERFRSLAKGAELSFADGINIVLGQNGTGKTTLLELISMVVRSDFSSLAKEEFAIEYELAGPGEESTIIILRNERISTEQIQTPIELGPSEAFRPSAELLSSPDRKPLLHYRGGQRREVAVDDKSVIDVPERFPLPLEPGFLLSFAVVGLDSPRWEHLVRNLIETGRARRLDESLDLFRTIIGTGNFPGEIRISKQGWSLSTFAPSLVPDSIIQRLKDAYLPGRPDYSLTHLDLGLLATLKDMLGFSAAELRIDVTEQAQPAAVQIGNLVFRFKWEDGTFITHERLSYGQKRLLTFFYYLACNPAVVIADELVNGLHHRWITASIEALGQRQAFLTSQNPLLLDYIPITSADEVRRSFVLCRGEPREGRPGWIWENMSEEDARELYSAYEVGVEHVSEILQSRGLW